MKSLASGALVLVLATIPAMAQITINVPQDHANLQHAINAASSGDTILVGPGGYGRIDYMGKTLAIRSTSGPGVTYIDGAYQRGAVRVQSGEGPGTLLQGFAVCRGRAGSYQDSFGTTIGLSGGGIIVHSSNLTIDRCIICDNSAGSGSDNCTYIASFPFCFDGRGGDGGGIWAVSSTVQVTNSLFRNNRAGIGSSNPGSGGALYVSGNSIIANCTFVENRAVTHSVGGGGIFTNCILWGNDPGAYGGGGSISHSIYDEPSSSSTVSILDPQFLDPASGDFRIRRTSPAVDAGLDSAIQNAGFGIDVMGDPRIRGAAVDIGMDEVYLAGTDEDFQLFSTVNGELDWRSVNKPIAAGDTLWMSVETPGATFIGAFSILAGEIWTPGAPPNSGALPSLLVDPAASFLVCSGSLPTGGTQVVDTLLPGLSGLNVRCQAIAFSILAANGGYATTHALDLFVQ